MEPVIKELRNQAMSDLADQTTRTSDCILGLVQGDTGPVLSLNRRASINGKIIKCFGSQKQSNLIIA
jgi:hypothetical protein